MQSLHLNYYGAYKNDFMYLINIYILFLKYYTTN